MKFCAVFVLIAFLSRHHQMPFSFSLIHKEYFSLLHVHGTRLQALL